jgi:hypothetical protein
MGLDIGGENVVSRKRLHPLVASCSAVLLAGCATLPAAAPSPQDAFFAALSAHCGNAYAGRLVSGEAADADMAGKAMVMHVRDCSADTIRIPFHVGPVAGDPAHDNWDRSRTWVITRTASGLRLKHDHRHKDGSNDAVTLYGGDTKDSGSAVLQSFAVDAESIALFQQNALPKSVTNIWGVEITGTIFAYELRRVGANPRLFRVEFDTARPVPAPPPPWGAK